MGSDDFAGLARHTLTTLGGGLVTSGVLSGDDLNSIVGGLVVLGGVVWSLLQKRAQRKAIAVALATQPTKGV